MLFLNKSQSTKFNFFFFFFFLPKKLMKEIKTFSMFLLIFFSLFFSDSLIFDLVYQENNHLKRTKKIKGSNKYLPIIFVFERVLEQVNSLFSTFPTHLSLRFIIVLET